MTARLVKSKFHEPPKVWGECRPNLDDDWQRGAFEAYSGLGVYYRASGKSEAYKAGRRAQLECLPRKENGRINWGCRNGGYWSPPKTGLEAWPSMYEPPMVWYRASYIESLEKADAA